MISVIIPIYNTEKYLPRCIESVLAQTYRNLDIVLIDDGSTDNSGKICDEYAEKDGRVRVFHKENGGPSSARNLGLEKAREKSSEYIGFIDSDDWAEPGMYEKLLNVLLETNADIAVCCESIEHTEKENRQEIKAERRQSGECLKQTVYNRDEAVRAHLEGKISTLVNDKLYNSDLFTGIAFPEGKVYEDLATVYKLILASERTVVLWEILYHYDMHPDSISHNKSMKNLTDYWDAGLSRYDYFSEYGDEYSTKLLLKECAEIITKIWRWAYLNPKEERDNYSEKIKEITRFTKEHFPPFGFSEWPLWLRANIFLAHSDSEISFAASHLIIKAYRKIIPNKYI